MIITSFPNEAVEHQLSEKKNNNIQRIMTSLPSWFSVQLPHVQLSGNPPHPATNYAGGMQAKVSWAVRVWERRQLCLVVLATWGFAYRKTDDQADDGFDRSPSSL
jgi:hypothetical protein